jgi:hypothetical protein
MKCNWSAWTAIATIVMALGSVAALIFLRSEFVELREANEIAVSIGRQSYRPIGSVIFSHENPDLIVINYPKAKTADLFSFQCDQEIRNKGAGVLVYIGSLSYLSKSDLEFRKDFLNGKLNSVRVDDAVLADLYPYTSYLRRIGLGPTDKLRIFISWENIPFSKQYFLYSLYLYEDQNGELYDTEHLDIFKFSEPHVKDGQLKTKLQEGSAFIEKYNYYSNEEKMKLINRLKKLKSTMVNALSQTGSK